MSIGLIYLHGVGHHSADDSWQSALVHAMADLGYPLLDTTSVSVCAPKYSDLLDAEHVPKSEMPRRTAHPKDTSLQRRRVYEVGQGRLRRLLAVDSDTSTPDGPFHNAPDDVTEALTTALTEYHPVLRQAGRYMQDEQLRWSVLHRVLAALPECDDLVIVGHSLGSLILIDLLDHLPAHHQVRRIVTLGSPAGLPAFHRHSDRLIRDFPYGQAESWLNVLSPFDPVTSGRGLTWLFPAAHDVRVNLPFGEHAADAYLRQPTVALAVGEALFGSLSTELVSRQVTADIGLTEIESQAMFALAYAHMTSHELERSSAGSAERYCEALAVVQSAVHQSLVRRALHEGRAIAADVMALDHGLAPSCPRAWTFDESIRLLVVTATTNLIAPWEITAHKAARAALPAASVGLGFGAQQGSKVSQAIAEARKALDLDRDVAWDRLLIGAAGVALIVAAPIGLALAAPAGLAGAAAITSALATFGPGGMVGGMALAGTLIGTGAVTTAASALIDAPQAVLEVEVLRRVAHARARQLLGLTQDVSDWTLLTELEGRANEDLTVISAFSDGKAPSVKMLREKVSLIRKAIEWMDEKGLSSPPTEVTI